MIIGGQHAQFRYKLGRILRGNNNRRMLCLKSRIGPDGGSVALIKRCRKVIIIAAHIHAKVDQGKFLSLFDFLGQIQRIWQGNARFGIRKDLLRKARKIGFKRSGRRHELDGAWAFIPFCASHFSHLSDCDAKVRGFAVRMTIKLGFLTHFFRSFLLGRCKECFRHRIFRLDLQDDIAAFLSRLKGGQRAGYLDAFKGTL